VGGKIATEYNHAATTSIDPEVDAANVKVRAVI
jgi:hypothetical protein